MSKLIVPLGLILGSIAIMFLFIVPGWQHFLAVKADSKRLDDINAEIDTLTQKRDALVSQINGITKDNLLRLDQMVPMAALGPEFLVFLQKLAITHSLHIAKLDLAGNLSTKQKNPAANPKSGSEPISQQESKKEYQTMNAVMEVSGPYQSFKDFLRELESSVRITNIETLSLAPKENEFLIKLSLNAYYQ